MSILKIYQTEVLLYLRFQEASAVPIHYRYGIWICNRDLIWRDPDKLPILFMTLVDSIKSSTPAAFVHIPEIRELRQKWAWDILYRPVADIWQNIVQHR